MAAVLAGVIRIAGQHLPESLQVEVVGAGGRLAQAGVTYTVGKDGEKVFVLALTDANIKLVQQLPRLSSVEVVPTKLDLTWVKILNEELKAKSKAKL